ncbi:MAG: DnaB-like helicase N-terminal domain-containing protein [Oscillospiraceae bacterium]
MEELLGRQPPHSAPAEQAVIGAMLIDPSCIPDVIEKVKSDEFYIQVNRDIFDTIFAMFSYGQSVDAVTVLEQMKVRGVYKDTTQQYLMEVMQITPTAANVLKYAAIVRDQALLRNLHTAADEINEMIFEGSGGADAMLEAAERKIYALRQGATSAACSRSAWSSSVCMQTSPRRRAAAGASPVWLPVCRIWIRRSSA